MGATGRDQFRLLILSLVAFFAFMTPHAASAELAAEASHTQHGADEEQQFTHSISGRFLLYVLQLDYEYMWSSKSAVRVGGELWAVPMAAVGLRVPVTYRHMLLSSRNQKHHLEVGLGVAYHRIETNGDAEIGDVAVHGSAAYRYQSPGGFQFRFGIEPDYFLPIKAKQALLPNMVLSFGGAF